MGVEQDSTVVLQPRAQGLARSLARRDPLRGGKALRMLLEALDTEELGPDQLLGFPDGGAVWVCGKPQERRLQDFDGRAVTGGAGVTPGRNPRCSELLRAAAAEHCLELLVVRDEAPPSSSHVSSAMASKVACAAPRATEASLAGFRGPRRAEAGRQGRPVRITGCRRLSVRMPTRRLHRPGASAWLRLRS